MKQLQAIFLMVLLVSLSVAVGASAQEKWTPNEKAFKTAEGTIDELYRAITFKANAVPDWQIVKKTFFIKKAVLAVHTAPDKMDVISRDEWGQLWQDNIKQYKLDQTGFQEKLIAKKVTVFGTIASCRLVYEASVPGQDWKQRGLNYISLLKRDGRWWIVSIINEVPSPGNPIPEAFLK